MREVETVCPGIIQIFGFWGERAEEVSQKALGNFVISGQKNVDRE
jgi:hypothetical protein